MDGLLSGLELEDGTIRFKVILGLEEMVRRFPTLQVDHAAVENAIISDAMLYFRRFVTFFILFGDRQEPLHERGSLLSIALTERLERVKERVGWLLSLVYPGQDIRRAWAALDSRDPMQRAHAIEFLDNLLTGNIKRYVFPLFSDAPPAERFDASLSFLGMETIDRESALRAALEQEDTWLTAATIWEIGSRGLRGFRDRIAEFLNSNDTILRETASVVIQKI